MNEESVGDRPTGFVRTAGGELWAARTVAACSAFAWAILFFGVIDLAVPIDETPGFYESYLLETGWGVLYTFLVGVPLLSLAVAPRMLLPLVEVAVVAVCLAVTAVAAGSWVQLVPAVLLSLNCFALVALTGRGREHSRGALVPRLDPAVGVVAVALVPPALLFAGDMVLGYREGRPPLDDDTWGIDHWPTQAALALAVAVLAVVAAGGVRERWSGTAVSAGTVVLAVGWFGFWSATYPGHAGSAGGAGGTGLLLWACVFTAVVAWRSAAHRARADRRRRGSVVR